MELESIRKKLSARTPGLMDCRRFFAVLVPLVEGEEGWSLLYEVRARTMKTQPGETAEQCALRETWEELAIPPEHIQLLGRLDFIAHRANFIMYPILGLVEERLEELRPSAAEVEEVFAVPLSHLLETEPLEYEYKLIPETGEGFPYELIGIPRDYAWQPGWENVPVYPWQGHAIWGLTGRITRHLVQLWKAYEK